ncbi:MAG TPA: hypothetical protein VJG29_00625 [Candidatus Paceibacterota bacterium]
MAGEGGDPGAGGDVIFIVVIIIVIASFWFLAGGPERSDVSLLIRPPSSPQIGETVTEGDDSSVRSDVSGITSEIKKVEDAITTLKKIPSSSQRGKVDIYSVSQAEETKPEQEYIVLKANKDSDGPLSITGWKLQSSLTGRTVEIDQGAATLVLGQQNLGAIFLKPGETAHIISGRSPMGSSFRTNICSGYLGQFQSFTPNLRNECPLPKNETTYAGSQDLGDACYDELENMQRCRIELNPPATLGESCRAFIAENLTYNGCVKNHREESGFFARSEWYIYLNQSQEVWKEKFEVVKLLDQAGNLVDSATY